MEIDAQSVYLLQELQICANHFIVIFTNQPVQFAFNVDTQRMAEKKSNSNEIFNGAADRSKKHM